jgi:CheY-like chemotaxis protein
MKAPKPSVEILLVEDDRHEARLAMEVFKGEMIANRTVHVADGRLAMDYLLRRGEFSGARRPDLVLLDLNLPGMDGREVLADIKSHPELRGIPVIVFTGTDLEEDIRKAYALHANCCVRKPSDIEEFIRVAISICSFWLSTARLPRESAAVD